MRSETKQKGIRSDEAESGTWLLCHIPEKVQWDKVHMSHPDASHSTQPKIPLQGVPN